MWRPIGKPNKNVNEIILQFGIDLFNNPDIDVTLTWFLHWPHVWVTRQKLVK